MDHIYADGYWITVRWHDGAIKAQVDSEAEYTVMALATESGLSLARAPDGRISLGYQNAAGTPLRLFSRDHGRSFS